MVLFLNGIPIVTLELKDQFSGQNVSNAIEQYKYDRSPVDAIRLYAFITQVCRMFDVEMQKFSVYAKFLLKLMPKREPK